MPFFVRSPLWRNPARLQNRMSQKARQSALLLFHKPLTVLWQTMSFGRRPETGGGFLHIRYLWHGGERSCEAQAWSIWQRWLHIVGLWSVRASCRCYSLSRWSGCWSHQHSDSGEAQAALHPHSEWCSRLMLEHQEHSPIYEGTFYNIFSWLICK